MRSSPDMVISISEDESVNGFAVGEDHCNYEDILVKDRPYDIDVLYSLATKITGDACYALIDYLYDKREEFEKAGVKVLNCRKDMREIFDGLMEDLEEGQEEHLI